MSEKSHSHNAIPASASEYERALGSHLPEVIQYQSDWESHQKSQIQTPTPIERPSVVEAVHHEPESLEKVLPTAEARERFNEFVEYRHAYPQYQEAMRQLAVERAPRGVRGAVGRLTNWWRARQDRLAVPSYTRPAPWADLGVLAAAGSAIDRQ
jgi:hypothetical protein